MSIYLDPAGPYPHPTLLPALMKVPAKEGQHQHENQATEVLAWLVDNSDVVARTVCTLFLDDLPHVDAAHTIGARTQITLPRTVGSPVYPDLSIEGSNASFQLLVEVKIAADLSETLDQQTGKAIQQDDLYRSLWANQGDEHQAAARAVGTLTRAGGSSVVDTRAMRARDVAWSAVRDALSECSATVEPEVHSVLISFVEAIDVHIAVKRLDVAQVSLWLGAHEHLVADTAVALSELVDGRADGTTRLSTDYASRYVRFIDTTGQEMRVRVFITPSGGRLNLPGHPDTLAVYLGRDSDATIEKALLPRLRAAGFIAQKDVWGFSLCRRHYELSDDSDAADLTTTVAQQVAEMLKRAELIPPKS